MADGVLPVVLFVAAAAWNLWFAAGASAQGVLTGEEASVDHRDPLALSLHWQPSIWSTNAGSQLFYLVAGHLTPDYGLLYARPVKAAAMALLPVLLYLAARRRLGCRPVTAAMGAALAVVLPGVTSVAWVGTENGLEAVWGVAALLVATSRRRVWPVAPVLAAISVANYTAGLAWAAVTVLVCLWRIRSLRDAALVVAGSALGGALVLAPLRWWHNGAVIVTGGGHAGADLHDWRARLLDIGHLLVDDGGSYYWFSSAPMLASRVTAAALAVAAAVALVRRFSRVWPWFAVSLAAAGLYVVSSGVPGSRRIVAIAVVAGLLTAPAVDELIDLVRPAHRFPGPAVIMVRALVVVAAIVAVAGPGLSDGVQNRSELASGTRPLPIDWPFPVDRGGTQASTFGRLDAALRSGAMSPTQVGDGWGGTRTLAVLVALSERNGRTPPLPPSALLAYYRTTDDCRELDGPAVCR
ncbi:hypothetical protein LQ327_07925 [Actinomycetospora endophytica]|uniref:Dolichyl-phosphate-mannose-protein mannosyltransferase n=1 Tax=Actinomycetospora endophytica TaxID=2291215 RepID=A0ABS8P4Y0_9PSEU|nr:hypothetical protein [Actinomycetospora endophytica]MCD2193313.1 hypothetical protein [Actinomycetospora endophytica]